MSIAAFPQPPKAGAVTSPTGSASQLSVGKSRSSDLTRTASSGSSLRLKKALRNSGSSTNLRGPTTPKAPSLLNSSGEGKSIPNGPSARNSQGHNSIPSPTQSRSSSAQGSYSTSATTFDDDDGSRKTREDVDDSVSDKKRNSKQKEGKGNVIVSVRVRPDIAMSENSKPQGEWMVDGRRSLISFHGKEGGDYYYGRQIYTYLLPNYHSLITDDLLR